MCKRCKAFLTQREPNSRVGSGIAECESTGPTIGLWDCSLMGVRSSFRLIPCPSITCTVLLLLRSCWIYTVHNIIRQFIAGSTVYCLIVYDKLTDSVSLILQLPIQASAIRYQTRGLVRNTCTAPSRASNACIGFPENNSCSPIW